MENKNMSTMKIHAKTMSVRIANMLNDCVIENYLKESLEDVKNKGKDKKLTFTIKAVCDIKTDETIEFEAWSEVTSTEKDTSEKIGETFDLKQVTINFGE